MSSSSISDHKRGRSHKRLGFVGLPRRVPLRTNEVEVDEYRDADDPEKGEKHDRKIPRNKEEVSVDGVIPLRKVVKSTEMKEQHSSVMEQCSTKITNRRLSSVSEEALSASKRRVHQTHEKNQLGSAASIPQHQPNSFPGEIQPRQPCPISAAATLYKQEGGHAESSVAANSHKRQTEQHNYPVSSGSRVPAPGAPVFDPGNFASNGVPPSLPISAPFASNNNILVVNGKVYNKLNNIGKGGSSKVQSSSYLTQCMFIEKLKSIINSAGTNSSN